MTGTEQTTRLEKLASLGDSQAAAELERLKRRLGVEPMPVEEPDGAVAIQIDEENPALVWWHFFGADQTAPRCIDSLRCNPFEGYGVVSRDWVMVTKETAALVLAYCESLPGWDDGPEHAPTALTFHDVEDWRDGEDWLGSISVSHTVGQIASAFEQGEGIFTLDTNGEYENDILTGANWHVVAGDVLHHFDLDEWPDEWELVELEF
jgi:hypothetical protein